MAVAFKPSQTLGRTDLNLFLVDSTGAPSNAADIYFAIYFVDDGPPEAEVLIGAAQRTPASPTMGEYYAPILIPSSATLGTYRIHWTFKEYENAPYQQVVQEFAVVGESTVLSCLYSSREQEMIDSLRLLLRDQNPDKFYHFRPPEHEGRIHTYNRVFGQIWEDAELHEYLRRGLDWWNMFPPSTPELMNLKLLHSDKPEWKTAIYWAAATHALFALALNWVADEFDYSIGGISLSIDKSSKYESLKQNAEGQFDKATEAKARTVKYIRGLKQPRFGIGIRSAFGPHVGRGILSPRNFV